MLDFIYDLIFPKRCVGCGKFGNYLCDRCFSSMQVYEEFVCPVCLKHSITGQTHPGCITPYALDGLASGVVYRGVVRKLLFSLKFKPYILDLKKTVGKLFIETINQNELFEKALSSHPIVTVVPLFSEKLRKRGYNQAEIFSEKISIEYKLESFPKILKRVKSTKPQFKLDKKSRFKNVQGAFEFDQKYKNKVRNSTIFLVDDLATSCATLRECAKVLKRAGAKKVYGITFAREI